MSADFQDPVNWTLPDGVAVGVYTASIEMNVSLEHAGLLTIRRPIFCAMLDGDEVFSIEPKENYFYLGRLEKIETNPDSETAKLSISGVGINPADWAPVHP